MNKKINTIAFILVGTIVNLAFAIISIGLLLLGIKAASDSFGIEVTSLIPFAFIGGIIIAMIVYQRLTKFVVEKFNLGEKLDPLITFKRHKK